MYIMDTVFISIFSGVHVLHTVVPDDFIMFAVNASVVGLCTVPEDMVSMGHATMLNICCQFYFLCFFSYYSI